jgi:hypothetical protein
MPFDPAATNCWMPKRIEPQPPGSAEGGAGSGGRCSPSAIERPASCNVVPAGAPRFGRTRRSPRAASAVRRSPVFSHRPCAYVHAGPVARRRPRMRQLLRPARPCRCPCMPSPGAMTRSACRPHRAGRRCRPATWPSWPRAGASAAEAAREMGGVKARRILPMRTAPCACRPAARACRSSACRA